MTKTAAEIELEVEASRKDLDRTVEELKEKMSPSQLFDDASRAMTGAGSQLLTRAIDQAKENPFPAAMIGLGVAWLLTSQKKKHSHGYARAYQPQRYASQGYAGDGYGGAYGSDGGGISEKAHAMADKASGALSSAKDSFSSAKDSLGHAASGAAQSTRSAARSAADNLSAAAGTAREKVGEYGERAQRTFQEQLDNDPIMVGALGLAFGLAVGAALPATAAENRYVGPVRDRILDKGKDLAQGGLEQAKGVAQAAYGSVKTELERTAEDGADPAERAEQVARAGVQAVQQELQAGRPN